MENLEKVEKLRERANVSYEEAKAALEAANWDLLDAMVALEKAGKTSSPQQESFSTDYEEQQQYIPVKEKVEEQRSEQSKNRASVRGIFRKFIAICRDNYFSVMKNDNTLIKVPFGLLVLALCFFWKPMLIAAVIALFFGVRYRFSGKHDLERANEFMESAEGVAERVKSEFAKKDDKAESQSSDHFEA